MGVKKARRRRNSEESIGTGLKTEIPSCRLVHNQNNGLTMPYISALFASFIHLCITLDDTAPTLPPGFSLLHYFIHWIVSWLNRDPCFQVNQSSTSTVQELSHQPNCPNRLKNLNLVLWFGPNSSNVKAPSVCVCECGILKFGLTVYYGSKMATRARSTFLMLHSHLIWGKSHCYFHYWKIKTTQTLSFKWSTLFHPTVGCNFAMFDSVSISTS